MQLQDILLDIQVLKKTAEDSLEIREICYDSRQVKPGDLFVAIRGFDTDGHKYIPSAAELGAAAVICEEVPSVDIPYVLVEDCRNALALAGRNFYHDPSSEMTVIAVTGTNGKTTSTYLLKHMIEEVAKEKVGLIGTNGNMIGDVAYHTERTTPESLELQKLFREMADSGCKYAVMEVSSHSLVLSRVDGIHFHTGIFTNLTQDHLDFHKTMEEYARAKALLFRRCEYGCFNIDDAWAENMMKDATCSVMTYSAESTDADLIAKDPRFASDGVRFHVMYKNELQRVNLKIPGVFSVYNALGVIAAGLSVGFTLEQCCEAMNTATGVKGRMEVVPTDGDYTILIDYAHTPYALENVLKSLRAVTKGRIVALFGCGGDRDRTKRPIMGRIGAENADFCIITSDNPRTEDPEAIIQDILEGLKEDNLKYVPKEIIPDRVKAIQWAIDNHKDHDVIVLCGKGHEDYQIVGHEKHHLDEREVIAEHLERRKKV